MSKNLETVSDQLFRHFSQFGTKKIFIFHLVGSIEADITSFSFVEGLDVVQNYYSGWVGCVGLGRLCENRTKLSQTLLS